MKKTYKIISIASVLIFVLLTTACGINTPTLGVIEGNEYGEIPPNVAEVEMTMVSQMMLTEEGYLIQGLMDVADEVLIYSFMLDDETKEMQIYTMKVKNGKWVKDKDLVHDGDVDKNNEIGILVDRGSGVGRISMGNWDKKKLSTSFDLGYTLSNGTENVEMGSLEFSERKLEKGKKIPLHLSYYSTTNYTTEIDKMFRESEEIEMIDFFYNRPQLIEKAFDNYTMIVAEFN